MARARSELRFETFRKGAPLLAALDDCIALEAQGWKDRIGTTVLERPGEAEFLRAVLSAYVARGEASIDGLRRDKESLAASIGLRTRSSFWYLTIVHDENEVRNSPGAQPIRAVTESILADPAIATTDSCAPPKLAVIGALWGEHRRLAHVLLVAGAAIRSSAAPSA